MKTTVSLAILIGSLFLIAAFAPLTVMANVNMTPRIRDQTSSTSTNWSGYAVDSSKSSVSDVKGSWIVPAVTASGTAYSSFWIGIDGDNSNTVEQIGTDSDIINGVTQYYAWYEMYPKNSYNINKPVSVGDTMSAEVQFIGSNKFTLTLNDITQKWSFSTTLTSGSAKRTSAEWIAEAPWSGGVLPLANFGTAYFSSCYATIGGATLQPISHFSNYDAITMTNPAGTVTKALPSPLDQSTGAAFSVTWYKAQ